MMDGGKKRDSKKRIAQKDWLEIISA